MQCNKNTPHPSPCFCRFKPRELTLHSTASFLLVWTHLLLFVSQSLPSYFPGNVSFKNWNHITTKKTVCLCSKLLLLPISLPRNLQPLAPPLSSSYSETVLKSFLNPSKRGAKTHGSCAASLLCAKERAAVHDNKGRMKGLALGAELEGQTPSLPSFLPMQPHMHIKALTKLNNRPSELST